MAMVDSSIDSSDLIELIHEGLVGNTNEVGNTVGNTVGNEVGNEADKCLGVVWHLVHEAATAMRRSMVR